MGEGTWGTLLKIPQELVGLGSLTFTTIPSLPVSTWFSFRENCLNNYCRKESPRAGLICFSHATCDYRNCGGNLLWVSGTPGAGMWPKLILSVLSPESASWSLNGKQVGRINSPQRWCSHVVVQAAQVLHVLASFRPQSWRFALILGTAGSFSTIASGHGKPWFSSPGHPFILPPIPRGLYF